MRKKLSSLARKVKLVVKLLPMMNLCLKGITGVPYFEIYLTNSPDGVRQVFSGAQPVETIVAVLNRLKMSSKV